ncbi:MAG: hypothetical protein WC227_02915 [Patescibacteria group bacterium]|jgi:hypothetical protein
MRNTIKKGFSLIWSEGPKIFFWWSVLGLGSLIPKFKNPYYYWLAAVIAIISLFFIIKKAFLEVRRDIQESIINRDTKPIVADNTDLVKCLEKNMPTSRFFELVYKHGDSLASDWASDGVLRQINFYIECKNGITEKTVQIYVYSKISKEQLMKILPSNSETVEILKAEPYGATSIRMSEIGGFKHVLATAIASASSEIAKSEGVKVQISPASNSVSINFRLNNKTRQWTERYQYQDNTLFDENNISIKKFDKK